MTALVLAVWPLTERLPAQNTVIRNFADERADYIRTDGAPQFQERMTASGWQLRSETVTVTCASREQALFVAQEFHKAWDETARIADAWSDTQRQPGFGLAAVQIYVGSQPQRSSRPVTLQFDGDVSLLNLDSGEDGSELEAQLPVLHMAAAASLLHTMQADRHLPQWVRTGLSAYVAQQMAIAERQPPFTFDSSDAAQQSAAVGLYELPKPGVEIQREPIDEQHAPADLAVRYLIEANDARQAPHFFEALQETMGDRHQRPEFSDELELTRPHFVRPGADTPVDQLWNERRSGFREWSENPLAGQPIFEPDENTTAELVAEQRKIVFVLKLLHRFAAKPPVLVQPRFTTFGPNGAQVEPTALPAARALSVDELIGKLTAPTAPPWTTLDAAGRLVSWRDAERLPLLLGGGEIRYETQIRDGRLVLTARSPFGRFEGWLEDNEYDLQRPFTRIEVKQRGDSTVVQPAATDLDLR